MRGLDLYCCAGLASDGYAAAGLEMVGVDIDEQPNYPGYPRDVWVWDALDVLREGWWGDEPDFIHASPPCQAHTRASHLRTAQGGTSKFDDLLTPTLALLRELDIPWVVENVPGAPMWPEEGKDEYLVVLCGSMFGLQVQRHRMFLANFPLIGPGFCNHKSFPIDPESGKPRPWGVYHVPSDSIPKGGRTARDLAHGKEVMGVPADRNITWDELKEGVPPAYTEWVGGQLLAHLTPVVP